MTLDMTKGNPLRSIVLFSIPMLIGGIFQLFYNLADTLVVGRTIGSQALAAVGATTSATFFLTSVALGFTSAFSIVIIVYNGAAGILRARSISLSPPRCCSRWRGFSAPGRCSSCSEPPPTFSMTPRPISGSAWAARWVSSSITGPRASSAQWATAAPRSSCSSSAPF